MTVIRTPEDYRAVRAAVPAGFEDKLKLALRQLRKEGVCARLNIQQCCRGCVSPEQLGMKSEDQPTVWHYGGQGSRVSFDRAGNPHWAEGRATDMCFNHDNGGAELLLAKLHALGIEADQPHEYSCVIVYPYGIDAAN